MRRRLPLAVATVLAFAPWLFPDATPAASAVPRCSIGSVRIVWFHTTGGLAGSAGDLFLIRNDGPERCVVAGYPGVAFLGRHGQNLDVAIRDNAHEGGNDEGGLFKGTTPPTVVLRGDGGVASFWTFGSDVTPPGSCITSTTMTVSLPGSRQRVAVHPAAGYVFPWCGVVVVHPIVAGESGNDPPRALSYFFGSPLPAS